MNQQQPVTERRFGKYLRMIREQRRLSLDAVEEMSLALPERVTKSHLSRIENGQAIPSFPRMFTLSQIYGVPVASMAERFELCLKTEMYPAVERAMSSEEILLEAAKRKKTGRYVEALMLYDSLLDRAAEAADEHEASAVVELRLERINCLVKLNRQATAKDECEEVLGMPGVTARQKVVAFQYLSMCCYKLGRFTVAAMAVESAEKELAEVDGLADLSAHLMSLKAGVFFATGQFAKAAEAYRDTARRFTALSKRIEVCRAELNVAICMAELDAPGESRRQALEVLRDAESGGYERQQALALSHLGLLAFRQQDHEAAEAYCLRSNRLARPMDYVSVLFRNCFYLWRIAQLREDGAAVRSHERSLRTLLTRVDDYIPEAGEFRRFLGEGR